MLLARPDEHEWWDNIETVNDIDGMIANFWRAVQGSPEAVARYADWPVNENDLHARHAWLLAEKQSLRARLEGDPEWFDPRIAGWWAWGISCWIGSGWVSGVGPWNVVAGELRKSDKNEVGINRQRPHFGGAGQGVHRKLLTGGLHDYFQAMQNRLRRVRVCCGDWSRITGPAVTTRRGMTGVFLDPPYSVLAARVPGLYAHDDLDVANDVRAWAIEHGENPLMRIALCGYEDEHEMPSGWACYEWSAQGGLSNNSKIKNNNKHRERIWFSPHCRSGHQKTMLEDSDE